MKYAVELDSGIMIYIPSFIKKKKTGPGTQKLMGGYTDPHRQQGYCISIFSFFFSKLGMWAKNRPKDTTNTFSNTPHSNSPLSHEY